eukprot:9793403-Alexandrium_andersonii.AAC.1
MPGTSAQLCNTDARATLKISHAPRSLNTRKTYGNLPAEPHSKLDSRHASPHLRPPDLNTNPQLT